MLLEHVGHPPTGTRDRTVTSTGDCSTYLPLAHVLEEVAEGDVAQTDDAVYPDHARGVLQGTPLPAQDYEQRASTVVRIRTRHGLILRIPRGSEVDVLGCPLGTVVVDVVLLSVLLDRLSDAHGLGQTRDADHALLVPHSSPQR